MALRRRGESDGHLDRVEIAWRSVPVQDVEGLALFDKGCKIKVSRALVRPRSTSRGGGTDRLLATATCESSCATGMANAWRSVPVQDVEGLALFDKGCKIKVSRVDATAAKRTASLDPRHRTGLAQLGARGRDRRVHGDLAPLAGVWWSKSTPKERSCAPARIFTARRGRRSLQLASERARLYVEYSHTS
jgi:hypothetical protein